MMYNIIIPPTIPQILTEQMFVNYGFFTGTATNFQIQAAFSIAENQVAREIGTFLYPTQVTDVEIPFINFSEKIQLPIGKLISIDSVVYHQSYTNSIVRYISGTSHVYDSEKGYVYFQPSENDISSCNGCGNINLTYPEGMLKINVTLTAGYPSGTASGNPLIQLSLCMAADIILKQMVDEGIGVYYLDQTRTIQLGRMIRSVDTKGFFGNTIFGPSNVGQFIKNILEPYKIRKAGKFGISYDKN